MGFEPKISEFLSLKPLQLGKITDVLRASVSASIKYG